jgi:hypothetical protein
MTGKNDKNSITTAAAAAAITAWVAAAAFLFFARSESGRLAEFAEKNLGFAEMIAPERAAVFAEQEFIAALPSLAGAHAPSIAEVFPQEAMSRLEIEESVSTADRRGLRKITATVKWSAINGEALGRALESASAAAPSFRLESISISKPAANSSALAVDAVFFAHVK